MKFKTNDQVKITLGKDKGKTSTILRVLPQDDKVVVKGINLYKRHLKARQGIEGGIFELERPMATAKVALICPSCKVQTRIGYSLKSGVKTRICRKCQAELPVIKETAKKTKSK
jgi:large subunit ribosomal protein L24